MSWRCLGTWLLISGLLVGCRDGSGEGPTADAAATDPPATRPVPGGDDSADAEKGDGREPATTAELTDLRGFELPPIEGDVRAVARIELDRYMGEWYEIARYPNSFQDGIVGVHIIYTLRDDGKIDVHNTGHRKTLEGPKTDSHATAWVVDEASHAKWYVQFIWPFRADYWVIACADDYSWAVVGQPSREYLWVISRTPVLQRDVFADILQRIARHGYNPRKLALTPQDPGAPAITPPGGSEDG